MAPDADLGVVDPGLVDRWGTGALEAVGVLGSFGLLTAQDVDFGDADLLNPNVMRDGMHDWVEANHRMAKALKAKGYEYQYLFCRGSRHSVGNAQQQFLPHALEWVWKGYASKGDK